MAIRQLFTACALTVAAFGATSAQALTISNPAWDTCLGQSSCSIEGATLSTQSPNSRFQEKTVNGATGLGITGGGDRTPGEIDTNESMNITFDAMQIVESIQILFIYNGPEFDDVAEVARIGFNSDGSFYKLTVSSTADNVASWGGPGGATNCGATTASGTGCFQITNPFGDTAISSLTLTSLATSIYSALDGYGLNQSDFSLGHVKTRDVPEPSTIALLALGLLGLGLARRFRGA